MAGLKQIFEQRSTDANELSVTLLIDKVRWRLTILETQGGIAGTFRIVPQHIPQFEQLGLPQTVQQLAFLKSGLIIVAGATGSGKTTTIASLLNVVNHHRASHIMTIEKPCGI